MASIDVDIEDYLYEVSTRDLEEELRTRNDLSPDVKKRLKLDEPFRMQEIMADLGIDNIPDVCKFEHFMKKFRNIPENEIDDFLNKY